MELFNALKDSAREKYKCFKENPEDSVARTISNSINHMNKRYEEKQEEIIRAGERKAHTLSDAQLQAHYNNVDHNSLGGIATEREMHRRGLL
jgi:vacuolar-type H+-ATPase subunit H